MGIDTRIRFAPIASPACGLSEAKPIAVGDFRARDRVSFGLTEAPPPYPQAGCEPGERNATAAVIGAGDTAMLAINPPRAVFFISRGHASCLGARRLAHCTEFAERRREL